MECSPCWWVCFNNCIPKLQRWFDANTVACDAARTAGSFVVKAEQTRSPRDHGFLATCFKPLDAAASAASLTAFQPLFMIELRGGAVW
jgi:hypothetical protein